jgi:putative membrane protein
MMRSLLVCSALLLAVPAVASAQAAPSTSEYMMKAGQSDMFEVQSGRLASTNAQSAGLRKFGAGMVTDHTKSTKMVMDAARKSGLPTTPPPMAADKQAMLTELQSKQGADFDRTYMAQQTQAHREALALQSSYAMGGADPNLKAAASQIVPVVKMHISMLEKMPMKGM